MDSVSSRSHIVQHGQQMSLLCTNSDCETFCIMLQHIHNCRPYIETTSCIQCKARLLLLFCKVPDMQIRSPKQTMCVSLATKSLVTSNMLHLLSLIHVLKQLAFCRCTSILHSNYWPAASLKNTWIVHLSAATAFRFNNILNLITVMQASSKLQATFHWHHAGAQKTECQELQFLPVHCS